MNAYRGRFAPSPTGPLHFGSLIAAVASYCEARARGGEWLVRMEDLDAARAVPGACDDILRTLEACGFEWAGEVIYQSRRSDAYDAALLRLQSTGRIFPCACSRREIADSALSLSGERIYPGTCRNGLPPGRPVRSLRLRVGEEATDFEDAVQGLVHQSLAREVGDFVVRRADGFFAYQLAVVVDDAEQGITDVVRGADLLASTPRQILLQRLLGLPAQSYAHVPVAVNAAGDKLSKQNLAPRVDTAKPAAEVLRALRFLGQEAPEELAGEAPDRLWKWALSKWNMRFVPRVLALIAVP
jgi:glutamyl-Q tRNA(Asp) synthetase